MFPQNGHQLESERRVVCDAPEVGVSLRASTPRAVCLVAASDHPTSGENSEGRYFTQKKNIFDCESLGFWKGHPSWGRVSECCPGRIANGKLRSYGPQNVIEKTNLRPIRLD